MKQLNGKIHHRENLGCDPSGERNEKIHNSIIFPAFDVVQKRSEVLKSLNSIDGLSWILLCICLRENFHENNFPISSFFSSKFSALSGRRTRDFINIFTLWLKKYFLCCELDQFCGWYDDFFYVEKLFYVCLLFRKNYQREKSSPGSMKCGKPQKYIKRFN